MAAVAVVLAVVAVAAVIALVAARRSLADATRRNDALTSELAAAGDDAVRATARADDAERARDAARDDVAARDALVQSLWSLELLRVAREWAVTAGPLPEAVAADVAAELGTAMRMEIDRRREETGIPGELDSSLTTDIAPAAALAALRVVEEVVAATSRASDGFTVGLASDGDGDDGALAVTITLDGADADVPAVLHEIAATAGASITVDGSTVTVHVDGR